MRRLTYLAKAGNPWAVVLYEWIFCYPQVPAEEVAAVLALLAEAPSRENDLLKLASQPG